MGWAADRPAKAIEEMRNKRILTCGLFERMNLAWIIGLDKVTHGKRYRKRAERPNAFTISLQNLQGPVGRLAGQLRENNTAIYPERDPAKIRLFGYWAG